ncbi:hypothetical protein ZIOFF_021499 [Zingiber officinale]|uniref:NEDD8-activating enzyme E1 catalytic subunit n=1 Tax=Zingiber officinale TaxID=94328 RepID=A0A8J5HBV5_ZINOF|nr:hypothetical protein ZIOFF_021499 [Zingiber officinale]
MEDLFSDPRRWRDVDKLLSRPGNIVGQDFEPSPTLREDIGDIVRVLVVGAGGLGCELLKDLALSGFKNIDVIDMDTIEVSNLDRQFLFRIQDVGKSKAEVAAERVMKRINGVNITSRFCRIEDKDLSFFNDFNIIVLGLDSIEARSYINSIACGFLEYDEDDKPLLVTIKPIVDGGTEETPITAAHCIELCTSDQMARGPSWKLFDADDPEHMQWVYSEALKTAELFGITGVTYSLAQGVVKNLIPAIASTNAIVSAACALETLKIVSGCSKMLSNYLTYNGLDGTHIKVTDFVRDTDCLFCGAGTLIELDTSTTLSQLLVSKASVTYRGKNLYMQSPPILEEMTRANLQLRMFDLMDKVPRDTSFLRKLRVVFKWVTDEASSRAHKLSRL